MKQLIIVLTFIWSQAFALTLSYEEKKAFTEMVNDIKISCPPKDCIYVGVGRSPTVVMKMLEQQEDINSVHLPLTYGSEFKRENRGLLSDERKRLYKHFDHFASELNGKRVMLIDYTQSGDGIELANKHLSEWSKARGYKNNFEQYRITNDPYGTEKSTKTRTVFNLSGKYSEVSLNFAKRKYSRYSKYQSFKVAQKGVEEYRPPRKNKLYSLININNHTFIGSCVNLILKTILK